MNWDRFPWGVEKLARVVDKFYWVPDRWIRWTGRVPILRRVDDYLFRFRVRRMISEVLTGQPDEIKKASFWETVGVLLWLLMLIPDMLLLTLIRRLFAKRPGGR